MLRIAIIGTGQIGYDLLHKLLKLDFIEFIAFVGRRNNTKVLPKNIIYSDKSIDYFILNPKCCDVVFDCTDANSAIINYEVFSKQGIKVIDLTPSNIGEFYIPYISKPNNFNNSMVTCGGQTSIPFLEYINNKLSNIIYAEVVTQINSASAGMATRINIDKYIDTTELAIKKFTNIPNCKVILNINPSKNSVMQTTIYIKTKNEMNQEDISFNDFNIFVEKMKTYIEKYEITFPVFLDKNILMSHIKITGLGDIISEYAGNLDIINCATLNLLKNIYKNIL